MTSIIATLDLDFVTAGSFAVDSDNHMAYLAGKKMEESFWRLYATDLTSGQVISSTILDTGQGGFGFGIYLPKNPISSLDLAGPDSGLVDTTHQFTATASPLSAATPVTYVWQATGQIPVTHTVGLTDTTGFNWEMSGLKHITVTVSNDFGAITSTHVITLYTPVQTDFVGDPKNGLAPFEVTFTNLSAGDYDTCDWDIGDGGGSNDCEPDDYVYGIPGVYTVTLTVNGPGGTDKMTKEEYIDVQNYGLYLPAILKP